MFLTCPLKNLMQQKIYFFHVLFQYQDIHIKTIISKKNQNKISFHYLKMENVVVFQAYVFLTMLREKER